MIRFWATFGYIGHLRPASGTWASVVAALLALGLFQLGLGLWLPLATVLVTLLGFWVVPRYIAGRANADPSEVVIDEVAGQWLALCFTFVPLANKGVEMGLWTGAWPGWLVPLVLFRFFDIVKPWKVGQADRRGDAAGVMLDDLWAGLFAGLVSVALAGVYHGVLLL